MRNTLIILAVCMLLFAGCIGAPASEENQTGTGNETIQPGENETGGEITPPPSQYPPGYDVKDYCTKDSDCVRQNKCCDCGAGEYVNAYHLEHPDCEGHECMCPVSLSHGECRDNMCIAITPQGTVASNESTEFYFRLLDIARCGDGLSPQKNVTRYRTALGGRIGTITPCYTAQAQLRKVNSTYFIVNITTVPLESNVECEQCTSAIPWLAEIMGYNGSVDVYYDNTLVYSDFLPQFCGWGKGECIDSSECTLAGCFQEVCQSTRDPPVETNCDDWRDCFDAANYTTECGCVDQRCQWYSIYNPPGEAY